MPLQLILTFSLITLFFPLAFSAGPVAKPRCQDRCGNLSIPYPFGVGSDCHLNPSFNINCNTSTNPSKPYLSIIDKEVIEINQSYIRVKYPTPISTCYDLSGDGRRTNATIEPSEHRTIVNLSGTPYTLSFVNRLTAIGCDDVVLQSNNGSTVGGGCSAFCAERNDTGGVGYCPFNASTVGNGCCEAQIRGGDATSIGAQLVDFSRKLLRPKLFPCSFAFIQERMEFNETMFSYPLYYLHNSTAMLNDDWASTTKGQPVVRLEWMFRAESCSQAKLNSTTYACRDEKSVCVDADEDDIGAGYRCSCVQGYEGNPYLAGGCQTISFSSSIAKFGCPDQCGKLSIPFPFGVGPSCYLAPSFEVICSTTTNPPRAYLVVLNAEIMEVNSSRVLVNYPNIGWTCYNLSSNFTTTETQSLTIDLSKTQYTLSDENWITTVGCDDIVVATVGESNRSSVLSSCAAICSSRRSVSSSSGYCPYGTATYTPGDGCCRAPIPAGTSYLEANLTEFSGLRSRTNFSCSYAFIDYYKDDTLYFPLYFFLNNSRRITPRVLDVSVGLQILTLDWRVGAMNCKEAILDPTNFACKSNSDCIDFDASTVRLGGYLCKCSRGYQGNPYLNPGCQDIDECADNINNPCDSNSTCINNPGSYHCSCPKGYIGNGRKDGTGCIQLPPSKSKIIIMIGMSSTLGSLLLLFISFWLYKLLQKRRMKIAKEKFFKRNGGLLLQQQTNEGMLGKTKVFPAKELEVATDNFNESRILGQGGQGTVYKGMLPDGKIVAVKKSKLVEENQLEQFINEVVILSQINHRNVVQLLGCCLETEVPLLVYEFMPNGTLYDVIHDPSNEFPFSWNMRLKIAADIAGALAYLHYASSMPIYHRDIKSSNILLDEKYIVKVADFGTSRSVAVDQTHLTTMVKGTFGYLDPEYFQSSQFTEKSDVHSFGVVLVELLTRQKPISFEKTEEERGLATRFLTCMDKNCLETILDPQIWEQGRKEDVMIIAVARIAQRCLNLKGKMRPTMKEVATELESLRISENVVVKDEFEDVNIFEGKDMMISDIEYTWTSSCKSVPRSPSDTYPLRFTTD